MIGRKKDSTEKQKFFCVENGFGLAFLIILYPSSRVHEKVSVTGVTDRKPPKRRNTFACFPALLCQYTLAIEVMMLLLRVVEIFKNLPI